MTFWELLTEFTPKFETESEHFQCDVSFELFSQLVLIKLDLKDQKMEGKPGFTALSTMIENNAYITAPRWF